MTHPCVEAAHTNAFFGVALGLEGADQNQTNRAIDDIQVRHRMHQRDVCALGCDFHVRITDFAKMLQHVEEFGFSRKVDSKAALSERESRIDW